LQRGKVLLELADSAADAGEVSRNGSGVALYAAGVAGYATSIAINATSIATRESARELCGLLPLRGWRNAKAQPILPGGA
jgi:hypothetical protein